MQCCTRTQYLPITCMMCCRLLYLCGLSLQQTTMQNPQCYAAPKSPPSTFFTRSRMESWLGSYGCSLLGISSIAGTGCTTHAWCLGREARVRSCWHRTGLQRAVQKSRSENKGSTACYWPETQSMMWARKAYQAAHAQGYVLQTQTRDKQSAPWHSC